MIYGYSWDALVERKKGEAVRAAVGELRMWAEETRLREEAAFWAKVLARVICVVMPGEVDDVWAWKTAPDGTRMPRTEITWRQAFPEMCPAEGQAGVYVSDMLLDLPEDVLSKAAEIFDKHGALDIWSAILQEGYDGLAEIYRSSQWE